MENKRMSAREVGDNIEKVVAEVSRTRNPVIVESAGERVAVVPLRVLEVYEREREAAFDEWRAIAERVNLSEEEASAIIEEAIAEARAERRARTMP